MLQFFLCELSSVSYTTARSVRGNVGSDISSRIQKRDVPEILGIKEVLQTLSGLVGYLDSTGRPTPAPPRGEREWQKKNPR